LKTYERQLRIARRWLPLILLGLVLGGLAGYAFASSQPSVYQATAELRVATGNNPEINDLLVAQRLAGDYARLATTRSVVQAVREDLGLQPSVDELIKQITVRAIPESDFITVDVRDGDREQAALIANDLADELIARVGTLSGPDAERQDQLEVYLTRISEEIGRVEARITQLVGADQLNQTQRLELSNLRQVQLPDLWQNYADLLPLTTTNVVGGLVSLEPAVPPISAVEPRPALTAALAAALGFILAVSLAFVLEYLRDVLRAPQDVEDATGFTVLGTVHDDGGGLRGRPGSVVTRDQPKSPWAEAYRGLRATIDLASPEWAMRTLLVTAAGPASAKTASTAANLAVAYAQSGRKVLLVDANLRSPSMHRLFGLRNEHGLTTVLSNDNVRVVNVIQPSKEPLLRVLTSGPAVPDPIGILESTHFNDLVGRMLAEVDLVVIDAPPLPAYPDATILSSFIQRTVLVVDMNSTRGEMARDASDQLRIAGASTIGVVARERHRRLRSVRGSSPAQSQGTPPGRDGARPVQRAGPS
jgi:capsular exopolysaccharide synthesis family protein